MDNGTIKEVVKDKYAQAAVRAATGRSSCCGTSPASAQDCCDPITSNLYGGGEAAAVPEEAVLRIRTR